MAKILIKGGRVFDGEGFLTADVLTDGRVIAKIAPDIRDSEAHLLDASGKTVTAGLVDLHTHLLVSPSDGFGAQAELATLPFGVTAAADAGREVGNTEILDAFLVKSTVFVNVTIQNNRADLRRAEVALAHFGARAVGVKVYFDTATSEVEDTAPLAAVASFAEERGLCVMVHATGSPTPMSELLGVLRAGDILTHAYHGGVHTAAEDGFRALRAAKARGVVIDAGFAGHIHTDFRILREAIAAGATPDTISTDITRLSAYTRGGRYGMTMCMTIAREAGMSEEAIFRAVTTAPAKALGKGEEWGSLRVGRSADIAILEYGNEGFSLTDRAANRMESKRGYRCLTTLLDGQIVYQH